MENKSPTFSFHCRPLHDRESEVERDLACPRILTLKTIRVDFNHLLPGHAQGDTEFLTAEALEVDMSGMGKIDLKGQVAEQSIIISGAGNYDAAKLESKNSAVDIRGTGKATIRAVEDLDVTIRGMGSVEYYGSPTVTKNVSGLGSVTSLGDP
jgi:hypothetical protein